MYREDISRWDRPVCALRHTLARREGRGAWVRSCRRARPDITHLSEPGSIVLILSRRVSATGDIVVMKFGGTSVGGGGRHQAGRGPDRRRARGRQAGRGGALGARQDDRRAAQDGPRGLRPSAGPRDGHAAVDRRADLVRALRDGDPRHGPQRDLADRVAGGDRHRLLAHPGADPRRARRPHPRGARRRPDRARRRLSGRLRRQPGHHHAGEGRLGHDRGRDRRRPGRRRLRDLHRRSRRVQRRPAARPRRAPAARSSRSRRCWRWRPRAPRCCSFARSSTPEITGSRSTAAAPSRRAPVHSSSREERDDGDDPW